MNFLELIPQLSILVSVLALGYAVILSRQILKHPEGNGEMMHISTAIREGAAAYLHRQSSVIIVVSVLLALGLMFIFGPSIAFGFLLGALASGLAGYLGMSIAVRSNNRTAQAARTSLSEALSVAFKGGTVTGLLVVGLGLLLVTVYYWVTNDVSSLVGVGFGASLISVFSRIGGGIYTKGADVGTDLVGKIEQGIPEDDPRNPGVIADNVGDNVGDCAGMAADLFETYCVTIIAAMILGAITFPHYPLAILFPLALGATAIIATILGTLFVRTGKSKSIMGALYKGLLASALLGVLAFYPITAEIMGKNGLYTVSNLFYASVVGVLVTFGLVGITEYYTSKKFGPIKNLAKSAVTGHGTFIITGLAISQKATLLPIFTIAAGIYFAHSFAGLYGIAIAAVSMLSLSGIIVAIDSFGPITDNAGGIAEMAKLPSEVREVTDSLDAVGNTTKAITKAYAIGSAGLASLVLFAAYTQELGTTANTLNFTLNNPQVIIGLLIGGALPFFFASLNMEAVGKTAGDIVHEIRRQFKEIDGIMEHKADPDYSAAVDIATKSALTNMILPALIPVVVPVFVGLRLGPVALGGLLLGSLLSGLFLALSMTTGGAAWDNAKKYIEEGNFGGKGSPAHAAAVTGDTVGDPYKDTAGPAINPMIKVINIVALLLAPFLV